MIVAGRCVSPEGLRVKVIFDLPFDDALFGSSIDEPALFRLGNGSFTWVRALSADEYGVYLDSLTIIGRMVTHTRLYDAVRINRYEFEVSCREFKVGASQAKRTRRAQHEAVDVNRRLCNYLSSFRLYLDHVELRLKRVYGKESEQVRQFKKAAAVVFGRSFAYRFFSKLRNYAQHCGPPISVVGSRGWIQAGATEEHMYTATVAFDTRSLLEEYHDGWSGAIREELAVAPAQLEVQPLLREVADGLEEIDRHVLAIEHPLLQDAVTGVLDTLGGTVESARNHVVGCYVKELGRLGIDYWETPLQEILRIRSLYENKGRRGD